MKSLLVITVSIVILIISSCSAGGGPSTFSVESRDFGVTSSRSIVAPSGVEIGIRSSDIEFWSTGGDFTNLQSDLYNPVAGSNRSTAIELSDTFYNIVFAPGEVRIQDYSMPYIDPDRIYDVARLDIGGGGFAYTINGLPISASSPVLGAGSLNANSIVFVDRSVLDDVVYVDRVEAADILNDYFDNQRMDGTYNYGTDTDFIVAFVKDNTAIWTGTGLTGSDEAFMDVNGALFVPFDPLDLRNREGVSTITISITLDMDEVFESESGGIYILSEIADGTPFAFDVTFWYQ